MFNQIKKRNGEIKDFDSSKITVAICKAGDSTKEFDDIMAQNLTLRVLSLAEEIYHDDIPTVEGLQDIVEEVLISSPYKKTAKSYIIYREQHSQMRRFARKANLDVMERYLQQGDWRVKENSNMSYSLQGLNNYISSAITAEYWLNQIYPPNIRDFHINGDFHIHDLSLLSVYCVGWDLADLLTEGFKGVAGKIESAPPKHFHSALGQLVNFFYTLQGEAAGAQAVSNFDTLLAPFIAYDKLSYEEVKQAIQEFVFNINIPTRVGFQTPFTNITMDLNVPTNLKDEAIIIGGKRQNQTYGEFQEQMDILNKAFAEIMMEGDAKGRVFTFPIPTYSITKDFDWDNANLDPVWKMTGKYGIPYFSNFVNSKMSPEDVRSMCCRLRLETDKMTKGGGIFGAYPLTGSIGVVTINMPRLGYLAKSRTDFFSRLKKLLDSATESLMIKRKELERLTENNLYPYSKFYLKDIKEQTKTYWANHFSTIGINGMNEACMNLLSKNAKEPYTSFSIGSDHGRNFASEVMDYINNYIENIHKETGINLNLEATPAEGVSYRFAKIDKEKYPDIICANQEEYENDNKAPFYTNSTHLPVNFSDDLFKVLDLQDDLQDKYTGGTVVHIYIGEEIKNPELVKNLVKKITSKYTLPYFTITPTFSICQNHGYLSGEKERCPDCGEATEVYSRVVGYLRPVQQWNDGKTSEFSSRKTFTKFDESKQGVA